MNETVLNRMAPVNAGQAQQQCNCLRSTRAMSDRHHVPIGSLTVGRHYNLLAALLTASPSVRDKWRTNLAAFHVFGIPVVCHGQLWLGSLSLEGRDEDNSSRQRASPLRWQRENFKNSAPPLLISFAILSVYSSPLSIDLLIVQSNQSTKWPKKEKN
jgi:hypothetical protein